VALNQVYYVQVKGKTPDGKLVITNPPEPRDKKKVKQVEAIVEPDLVYPLLRGRDVKKWCAGFKDRYVIIPHEPETAKPILESEMKIRFPSTYQYLNTYRNELENRSIHKLWGKGNPYYAVYDIGIYTFASYKVVWKNVAGEISGKAEFSCAVIGDYEDKFLGRKMLIPNVKLMLVPLESEEEAHYLCGVLNSMFVRAIVASYVIETGISTHILDTIKPPRYSPNNILHKKIASLSGRAHELAKCIHVGRKPDYCRRIDAEQELRNVEREIDLAVAQLFGLSEDDLREFEKLMAILSGRELPSEGEEVEIPEEPKVSVLNTLLPPDTRSYVEVDVVNPSGEEVEFYYEFPWGRGSFRLVEGRYRVEVPPLKPGKYDGVVKYRWRGVERTIDVVVEVSEPLGPKRRRGLLPGPG